MLNFFLGLVMTAAGFLITWKSELILQNFGTSDWAESKFGPSGGSRTLYKLLGIGIALLGVLTMTGLIKGFLLATVGWLFLPPGRQSL